VSVSSVARRAAALSVKATAAGIDAVRRPPDGVVVLLYHRVGGGTGSAVDLPLGLFERQMTELAGRAIDIDAALDGLSGNAAPTAGAVVVTFDDGTADFAEIAVPILERHGVPATLYLATGFVDGEVPLPLGGRPVSWSALRDACSTGLIDIGSHTHTHRLLDRVTRADAAVELDRSIDLIGEHLGQPALDFAYPKAVPGTRDVVALVRDRFRSAALSGTRVNPFRSDEPRRATDPQRLARSPIQVSDGMDFFARKLAGGMGLEDAFRRAINRVRYARLAT